MAQEKNGSGAVNVETGALWRCVANASVRDVLLLGIAWLLSGCSQSSSKVSNEIAMQALAADNRTIDLRSLREFSWSQVCFFGPYSGDSRFEEAVGFSWPLVKKTRIETDDSINVLTFIDGQSVVAYVTQPRSMGDFWRLSGQCFPRSEALFSLHQGSYVNPRSKNDSEAGPEKVSAKNRPA